MIVVSSLEIIPFSSLCFSEYSAVMDPNLTLEFLLDVHAFVVPKAVEFCCFSAAFSPGQVFGILPHRQQLPGHATPLVPHPERFLYLCLPFCGAVRRPEVTRNCGSHGSVPATTHSHSS